MTPEQLEVVETRRLEGRYGGRAAGGQANREKFRKLREEYQQEGRKKAKELDPLHIAGCMLYWGEGTKSRNTLSMTNSDEAMLIFYLRFLKEQFGVKDQKISIHINCYTNNGLTLEEIESYWLKTLDLPYSCLRKSSVNNRPRNSKQQGRKLLYGTCKIMVHNVQILHHIYGAIQEYSGLDKPEWVL